MSEQERVFSKCAWRLVPLMMLLFLLNFLDRVNVGFAALTMNKDLSLTPSVFGVGAGLLFLSYSLFAVPSGMLFERTGARRSVFYMLVTWGALSAANAFVQGPVSFYILRFLLGAAEAGLSPGLIFYLTLWFPRDYRARLNATYFAAAPLSFVIGGPISGAILGFDGLVGLHGWQWLFLLEGLPACVLGFVLLKILPDGPASASWLTASEKRTIIERLSTEDTVERGDLWSALCDPRVLVLCLVSLGFNFAGYGVRLWLPQIVQSMGFSNLATGFVVAMPYFLAMGAMILWGRSSDAHGERIWHVAFPALLAAAGLGVASLAQSNLAVLLALTIALIGQEAIFGPAYSLPSSFLAGRAMIGGVALMAAVGNFGGFFGPSVVGMLKEWTGSYASGMAALAAALVISAVAALALGRVIAWRPELSRTASGP